MQPQVVGHPWKEVKCYFTCFKIIRNENTIDISLYTCEHLRNETIVCANYKSIFKISFFKEAEYTLNVMFDEFYKPNDLMES